VVVEPAAGAWLACPVSHLAFVPSERGFEKVTDVPASIKLEQEAGPPPFEVVIVQSVPDEPREVPVTEML
jgi:hypothetical protein